MATDVLKDQQLEMKPEPFDAKERGMLRYCLAALQAQCIIRMLLRTLDLVVIKVMHTRGINA